MNVENIIQKSAGIYLRDRKLLIVRKRNTQIYILPGGKLEKGETYEVALIREFEEELNVTPEIFEEFRTYTSKIAALDGRPLILKTYLIEKISCDPTIGSEIAEMQLLDKQNYRAGKYNLASLLQEKVISDLIKKGLIL